MHPTTILTARPSFALPSAIAAAASRIAAWLQRTWHELTLPDDERFIRGATDLADLERRQRWLERGPAIGRFHHDA